MKFPIWLLWTFVTWLDGPKSPNSFVFRCSNATNPMIWNRHLSKTLIASHSYRKHPVFPPPLLFLSSLNCQQASQIIIQPTIKRAEQTWIRYGILRTLPAAILCHHFLCTPCSHYSSILLLSPAADPPLAHQLHTAKSIPFLEKLGGSILYLTLISAATAHDNYHLRPVSMSATFKLVPTLWKQPTSHSIAPKVSVLLWQCLFQDNCCVVETKSTQIVYMGNDTNTFSSSKFFKWFYWSVFYH